MRSLAILISSLLLVSPAMAEDPELPVQACAGAVGTFLTQDTQQGGDGDPVIARSLIALTNGGHVIFVDSGERGEPGYAPFSDGLGRWRCLSKEGESPKLRAIILDFTLPIEGGREIARLDLEGTVDASSGTLTATATLSFYPLEGDPLTGGATGNGGQFVVIGHKVVAPH